jgi:hypothetical protein
MQLSDLPRRLIKPFGVSAGASYIRTVPFPSQIGTDDGAASYTDGFPPDTFDDISAGGIPPDGRDVNGVLFDLSSWARWQAAGGQALYSADFVTNTGGYPKYSLLASTTPGIFWQSTVDNNTTDPDGPTPTNWLRVASPPSGATSWTRLPDGKIMQWGYAATTSTGEPVIPVTLVVPLTNAAYNVNLTPSIDSASGLMDTWVQIIRGTKTGTGFSVQYQRPGGSTQPGLNGFEWTVVGGIPA